MTLALEELKEKVWVDPLFAKQPLAVQKILWSYIQDLPILLERMLDDKADLANILRAKESFVKYCLGEGLPRQLAKIIPSCLVFTTEEVGSAIESKLEKVRKKLDNWAYRNEYGETSKKSFAEKARDVRSNFGVLGMGRDVQAMYTTEIPTIRQLMEAQIVMFANWALDINI